jgi:transcription antitermination factor NusG
MNSRFKNGDHVVIVAGPYRGRTGIVRRRARDGHRYIVNVDGGTSGIPLSPLVQPSELRRVQATQNATKPDKP